MQNALYLCMCGSQPVGCEDVLSSDFKQVCVRRGELQELRALSVCQCYCVLEKLVVVGLELFLELNCTMSNRPLENVV